MSDFICAAILQRSSAGCPECQSVCVCRGETSRQLEWVLLDAHFTLLQRLIQQGARHQAKNGEAVSDHKEMLALAAPINLMSIAPLAGEGRRRTKK